MITSGRELMAAGNLELEAARRAKTSPLGAERDEFHPRGGLAGASRHPEL